MHTFALMRFPQYFAFYASIVDVVLVYGKRQYSQRTKCRIACYVCSDRNKDKARQSKQTAYVTVRGLCGILLLDKPAVQCRRHCSMILNNATRFKRLCFC